MRRVVGQIHALLVRMGENRALHILQCLVVGVCVYV